MHKFFNIAQQSKNISLKKFNDIKNKICILRSCGGFGDIINMRMIFEEIKSQYPDFHVTWAVPHEYFAAAEKHPFVDEVVQYSTINQSDYIKIYNLTNACTRYEWGKGKNIDKNRADIWSEHIGLRLFSHKTHMPNYSEFFPVVRNRLVKLGWDEKKKIVIFAPKSALSVKDLTNRHCNFIKSITSDFFLVILHSFPILELIKSGIPMLTGLNLKEAMAAVQMCDLAITTDTGIMHCAAGYGKHTMSVFSYTNGYLICKYYPTVSIVQRHSDKEPDYCGPCNNYLTCTESDDALVKPCMTTITDKMLENGWIKTLENYNKAINKGISTLI